MPPNLLRSVWDRASEEAARDRVTVGHLNSRARRCNGRALDRDASRAGVESNGSAANTLGRLLHPCGYLGCGRWTRGEQDKNVSFPVLHPKQQLLHTFNA